MTTPKATITIKEGQLGTPPEQTDNVLAVLGYCTLGTVGAIYDFSNASANEVEAALGRGRLARLVAQLVQTEGHGPIIAVPLTPGTVGANSAVSSSGTAPPAVTLTGTPFDDGDGRIEILSAGVRGTSTFRYSLDAGVNWSAELVTAATYAIPNSGITINFANTGPYAVDNRYSWTSTAPSHTNTNVTDGLTALRSSGRDFGFGVVLCSHGGATDTDRANAMVSLFSAVATAASAFEAGETFIGIALEAPKPVATDAAGMTSWRTALNTAQASMSDKRVMVAAGHGQHTAALDSLSYRTSAIFAAAVRLSQAPISEDLGRVASGAIDGWTSIEHDQSVTGGLSARYTTMRTIKKKPGFFLTEGRQMAAPGSDYELTANLRVINAASAAVLARAYDFVNESVLANPSTGRILEEDAAAIDRELTSVAENTVIYTTPQHASSVSARISRTDPILSTRTGSVDLAVQPKGYFKRINVTVGMTRATATAAA
jgi:hypothetical protein